METLRKIALPATKVFHNRSLSMNLLHRQTCSNFRDMIKVVFFVTWSRCLWVTKNLKSMISPKFWHVCRCSNLPYFRDSWPKLFLVKTYHPKTTILTSENNFGLLSVIMCDNIWNMLCFLWYSLLEILEFLKHIAKFCIFMGFRGTFNTFVTCTLRTWNLKLI